MKQKTLYSVRKNESQGSQMMTFNNEILAYGLTFPEAVQIVDAESLLLKQQGYKDWITQPTGKIDQRDRSYTNGSRHRHHFRIRGYRVPTA